jgi:putative endonuclease
MADAAHLRRGRNAEDTALTWLQQRGLRCVDRNVRCRFGEIDLVMRDHGTVVFVEVRFRRAGNKLGAAASIDAHKQHRLALAASWYLARQKSLQKAPVRFDVIAIDGRSTGHSALQWIKDAFRPGA